MKFSIKDFFSKCAQIRRKLKKSLMENFIFCAVTTFSLGHFSPLLHGRWKWNIGLKWLNFHHFFEIHP